MPNTKEQFEQVISLCRELFGKKLKDYGPSWRIMRPQSVTDQIFIKANRIRSLEIKGTSMVDEGIRPEFIAIVNYGVIGLIQLALGFADTTDITIDKALELYDKYITETKELMYAKNPTLDVVAVLCEFTPATLHEHFDTLMAQYLTVLNKGDAEPRYTREQLDASLPLSTVMHITNWVLAAA